MNNYGIILSFGYISISILCFCLSLRATLKQGVCKGNIIVLIILTLVVFSILWPFFGMWKMFQKWKK